MKKSLFIDRNKNDVSLLTMMIRYTTNHTLSGQAYFFTLAAHIRASYVNYLATSETPSKDIMDMVLPSSEAAGRVRVGVFNYFGAGAVASKFLFILPSFLLSAARSIICLGVDRLIPKFSPLATAAKVFKGAVNFVLGAPELILTSVLVKPVDMIQKFIAAQRQSSVDSASKKIHTSTAGISAGLDIHPEPGHKKSLDAQLTDKAKNSENEAVSQPDKTEKISLQTPNDDTSPDKHAKNGDNIPTGSFRR